MEVRVTEELLKALANTLWMAGRYLEATSEDALDTLELVQAKAAVSNLFTHLVGNWEKKKGMDYLELQLLEMKIAALWPERIKEPVETAGP